MGFSYRTLICGGHTFCFCLPVGIGVISMSILGCLVAGILTILLWFQVSISSQGRSSYAAFVLAALMETILLFASMLGLFGAMLKHRSLIKIYAYIIYTHFVINFGVAAYLIIKVLQASQAAQLLACQTAIQNPQAQGQCADILGVANWVVIVVTFLVLSIEMYGAIVVTRYINQVEHEKANMRSSRMETELAFRVHEHRYTQLHDTTKSGTIIPPGASPDDEFDPYIEHGYHSPRKISPDTSYNHTTRSNSTSKNGRMLTIEEGYGGGTWTHADVASRDKQLQEEVDEMTYQTASQPNDHTRSEFDIPEDDAVPLYTPHR